MGAVAQAENGDERLGLARQAAVLMDLKSSRGVLFFFFSFFFQERLRDANERARHSRTELPTATPTARGVPNKSVDEFRGLATGNRGASHRVGSRGEPAVRVARWFLGG